VGARPLLLAGSTRWLVLTALVVSGCGSSPSQSVPQFASPQPPTAQPPATQPPAAQPPPNSAGWSWSECGTIEPQSSQAVSAQFALGDQGVVVGYVDGSLLLYQLGQVSGRELRAPAAAPVSPASWAPVPISPDGLELAQLADTAITLQKLTDLTSSSIPFDASQCGRSVAFTPDGAHLLLSGAPAVCLVSLPDGALVTRVPGNFSRAAFGGGGLVVETEPGTLTTFAADGSTLATTTLALAAQTALRALSPAGEVAVACDNDQGSCTVYDTATGAARFALSDELFYFDQPIFSSDGQLVAGPKSVFRVKDGSVLRAIFPDAQQPTLQALSQDGQRVVRIDGELSEKWAEVREVESGAGVQVFGAHAREVLGVAVSPDGNWLFTTSGDGALAHRIAATFQDSLAIWSGHTGLEMLAEFSRDSSLVAISGDGRGVFASDSGIRVFPPPIPPAGVISGCYNAYFGFSSNAQLVAGGGYDFHIDVFDTKSQTLLKTLLSVSCNTAATFSPDNSLLATSAGELFRTQDWTRLWPESTEPEAPPATLTDEEDLTRVEFMPDGSGFVSSVCSAEPTLTCTSKLYSMAAGAQPKTTLEGSVLPSLSADGQWLVLGNYVQRVQGGGAAGLAARDGALITAAAFAPNGDIFAGDGDGRLHRFCVRP
jgi:WD40 repeat protein